MNVRISWSYVKKATRLIGLVCLLLLSPVFTSQASVGDQPDLLTRLTRSPLVSAPALSSDGHFISALVRQENGTNHVGVWAVDAGFSTLDTLPYNRLELNWLGWVGGGRLLLSLKEKGLVLYDAHVRRLRPLIDQGGPRPDELPPLLLSDLPHDPTHILMQWEDPGTPGFPAVYKVDAVQGTSQKIISAWRPIIRWWASPEGEVHLGEGFKGQSQRLFSRRSDGGWQLISNRNYFKGPAHSVLTVESGGATALVLSAHAGDKRDLWRMDIKNKTMLTRLASHPDFDMASALIDPVTDLAIGAHYIAEGYEDIIWQADWRAKMQRFSERLGRKHVSLMTASRDGRRILLRSMSTHRPSQYFLYDHETDTFSELPADDGLGALPKPQVLGVRIPVKGMKEPMHGILAHPETGPKGKAIVLVHGGPVNRSLARFQPYVSLMTARGYSVLQPNFRGSSGYGEKWRRAGYAEWGRRMQEDVRHAAEWLVNEDISQPGQMCVAGGSYGGYAALLSSAKDDDLFACAASLNGVTSLPHLVDYLSRNRFHDLTVPRIKSRLSVRTLKKRSPLYRVDLVRTPLLLLHATHDTNVPFQHATMMVDALFKHDKDYEFIVLKDAEHVLRREKDRRTYLQSSLDFFEKHLGAVY